MLEYAYENKEWLFSGIGVTIFVVLFGLFKRKKIPDQNIGNNSSGVQAGRDVNINVRGDKK